MDDVYLKGVREESYKKEIDNLKAEIDNLKAEVKYERQLRVGGTEYHKPSPDYTKLLEMWREEKGKRQEQENRVKELDNSLSIALEINDKYQRELKEIKEK
jgi:hypothetical protein